MKEKVHGHPPSHYNHPTTTAVVTHSHPGHPGAVVHHPVPMQTFVPGYVPYVYNPNQFFQIVPPSMPHQLGTPHGHDPHVHGHDYGNRHGHK